MGAEGEGQQPEDNPETPPHPETSESISEAGDGHRAESIKSDSTERVRKVWRYVRSVVSPFKHLDAVALFTAVLAWVAWLQWRTLEKTDATWQSQNAAYEASQRAFVYPIISTLQFTPSLNPVRHTWNIYPDWENSGNIPTVGLTVETHCGLLEFSADEPNFPGNDVRNAKIAERIIAPHQRNQGVLCAMTKEMIANAITNNLSVYTLLRARYLDVFGGRHTTESCHKTIGIYGDPNDFTKWLTVDMTPCRHHNCADAQCEDEK